MAIRKALRYLPVSQTINGFRHSLVPRGNKTLARAGAINIEKMMAKRGVPVTYETVREWCQKFGSLCAAAEKKESAHRIKMAPGRSLHQDEWRPTLFMASRG